MELASRHSKKSEDLGADWISPSVFFYAFYIADNPIYSGDVIVFSEYALREFNVNFQE